ncbi:MAG: hypothetical protein IKA03_04915 [Alphaproteobacteria bacterium]|nr:hypothetical protein [Alphaproteobacteria bacterium]
MKKTLLSMFVAVNALLACTAQDDVKVSNALGLPAPVAYTEWDRAIRVDVDMQTMYAATPRRIEKPIDMYMAFALALKYNYTRRIISYQQGLIDVGKSPINRLPEVFLLPVM